MTRDILEKIRNIQDGNSLEEIHQLKGFYIVTYTIPEKEKTKRDKLLEFLSKYGLKYANDQSTHFGSTEIIPDFNIELSKKCESMKFSKKVKVYLYYSENSEIHRIKIV